MNALLKELRDDRPAKILDLVIQAISSEILIVELLNLGAGVSWDIILWNSNFSQPVFAIL